MQYLNKMTNVVRILVLGLCVVGVFTSPQGIPGYSCEGLQNRFKDLVHCSVGDQLSDLSDSLDALNNTLQSLDSDLSERLDALNNTLQSMDCECPGSGPPSPLPIGTCGSLNECPPGSGVCVIPGYISSGGTGISDGNTFCLNNLSDILTLPASDFNPKPATYPFEDYIKCATESPVPGTTYIVALDDGNCVTLTETGGTYQPDLPISCESLVDLATICTIPID